MVSPICMRSSRTTVLTAVNRKKSCGNFGSPTGVSAMLSHFASMSVWSTGSPERQRLSNLPMLRTQNLTVVQTESSQLRRVQHVHKVCEGGRLYTAVQRAVDSDRILRLVELASMNVRSAIDLHQINRPRQISALAPLEQSHRSTYLKLDSESLSP